MSFKDILIHIDDSPQCGTRLELAINLAKKHGSHLTGLYVITHPHYVPQHEAKKQQATAAKERFQLATENTGVSTEWILADWGIVGVGMSEIINHYAHQKGLIIVGQTSSDRLRGDVPADLPERIVFGSGRPVLVVPYAGKFITVGTCSVVAWRGGRASARAVNDALPLLQDSEKIYVLSIKTSGDKQLSEAPGGDICTYLSRYGLTCTGEDIVSTDIPVANILMNFAWDKGCDLLVVGVYAHTLSRKLKLGPVARQLLDDMTLPVLMSH
jgi:nucleotide-binding universal stress UspA family protein